MYCTCRSIETVIILVPPTSQLMLNTILEWPRPNIWHCSLPSLLKSHNRSSPLQKNKHTINVYKTTKIVRMFWLAERSVCMRVCKHGCGVKMFCFSRANHTSTNLKKFSSSKLNKFTLFAHSLASWNLENHYKEGVSIFFV